MPRTGWVVKALVLGLVLVVAQGCVSVGKYNDLKDNYRRLQEQLNDANSKLADAQGELDRERAVAQTLEGDLRKLRGVVDIPGVTFEKGILSIEAAVLFDSGKATVKTKGKDVLARVAGFIKESGLNVRIDGHTDSDPIKRSGWASNHHLAAARALAVFQAFLKNGLSSSQMHVVGWGPNRPKASNASSAGKRKNRRVEVIPYKPESLPKIVPKEGAPAEAPVAPKRVEPNPKT